MGTCFRNGSSRRSQVHSDDQYGTDFSRKQLSSCACANSAALRTALLQWCPSSRNFGASPTVSAGNGTGAVGDNRTQVDPLKKGKGKGKGKLQEHKQTGTSNTSSTSDTDVITCKKVELDTGRKIAGDQVKELAAS